MRLGRLTLQHSGKYAGLEGKRCRYLKKYMIYDVCDCEVDLEEELMLSTVQALRCSGKSHPPRSILVRRDMINSMRRDTLTTILSLN